MTAAAIAMVAMAMTTTTTTATAATTPTTAITSIVAITTIMVLTTTKNYMCTALGKSSEGCGNKKVTDTVKFLTLDCRA